MINGRLGQTSGWRRHGLLLAVLALMVRNVGLLTGASTTVSAAVGHDAHIRDLIGPATATLTG